MNTDIPDRLPTRPLRNWLLAWHIHTGDPIETIAQGFGLPTQAVAELLSDRPPLMTSTRQAFALCEECRVDPPELWPNLRGLKVAFSCEPVAAEGSFSQILAALR